MDIRIFSKYYQLSLKDKVIPITCEIDPTDGIMVPNLSDDDIVYLYCLSCNFKLFPGLELYNNIISTLEKIEVNGKD